jgi:tetratricopeptide (TPR) repeat protein
MNVLEKKPTANAAAYDLYLRGLYASHKGTRESLEEAFRCFEMATKKDPTFSLAYSAWGNAYVLGMGDHFPRKEAYPRAKELVARALELDPNSSEAHMARGNLALQGDLDWKTAEIELQKAISLNPGNAEAHLWFAGLLATLQRFEEGMEQVRETLRVNPMMAHAWNQLVGMHYVSGDIYTAASWAEELLERDPTSFDIRMMVGFCYATEGRTTDALKVADLLAGPPDLMHRVSRAVLYGILGKPEEAGRLVAELEARAKTTFVPLAWIADLYAVLGEKAKALDVLERDFREGDRALWLEYLDPQYDQLRTEPRFVSLLRGYNLPTEMRERPLVVPHLEEVIRPSLGVPT